MKRFFCLLFLISISLSQGCYRGCPCPEWRLPEKFAEDCQDENCQAVLANLGIWWKQFEDPILDYLIENSFKCNYDVRIARDKAIEARAQYRIAYSQLLPDIYFDALALRERNSQTVLATGNLGSNSNPSTSPISFFPKYQTIYRIGFDSTWELDFFGKNYYAMRGACFDILSEIENVRDVNVTAIGDIGRNYVTIRGLQEQIQVTEEAIIKEQDLLDLTKDRYRAGLVSETDVFQAAALVEQRRATLPSLQANLNQTIYSLGILVGILPEDLLEILCPPQCIPCAINKIPLGLPSDLLLRRGDIRRAERQWQAAGFRVASAKASLFPSFYLLSSYGYESSLLEKLFNPASRTFAILPILNWPIFDAGKICANIQVQSSEARQALFTYEKTIVQALSDVESALVAYCREYERQNIIEKEAQAYKRASELIRTRYVLALVDFSEVLQAEQLYYDSALQLVLSKQNLMVDLVAIYKALGGGWECCTTP